jgi:predicted NUDIX family NTP pyrophosphohydrolase
MPKQSAGLLPYRLRDGQLEVFLVHPGGPFWARKDEGAWSIPKGEFADGEDALATAQRELTEETGFTVAGPFRPLGTIRQAGGKLVHAFAVAADFDAARVVSNQFELEWPPRSGRKVSFPEVDRAAWFNLAEARVKMNPAQAEFLPRLQAALAASNPA